MTTPFGDAIGRQSGVSSGGTEEVTTTGGRARLIIQTNLPDGTRYELRSEEFGAGGASSGEGLECCSQLKAGHIVVSVRSFGQALATSRRDLFRLMINEIRALTRKRDSADLPASGAGSHRRSSGVLIGRCANRSASLFTRPGPVSLWAVLKAARHEQNPVHYGPWRGPSRSRRPEQG